MTTLLTDPALLELIGTMASIKQRLQAIDPSAAAIRWLGELKALGDALSGTTANLAKLRNLMLADAMEAGLDGIDAGAEEGSPPHTRALLYACAEAAEFNTVFGEWPAEFTALNKTISASSTSAAAATKATAAVVSRLDSYLQEPQIKGLIGNPWGVPLVEPVQSAVSALRAKLS